MTSFSGLVVGRYGEIALKGKNQPRFRRQLRHNLAECLSRAGIEAQVQETGRRLHVRTDDPEAAAQALTRVFGLTSLSPAEPVPTDMAAIEGAALRQLQEDGMRPGDTIRVAARRAFKGFPLTSPEINRAVGEYLVGETGAGVDLSDQADHTVGVEVHEDHALVYARVIPGAGGLPVPMAGRVVVLMSAGLDSPVAAWMMMKRGCAVIPLHFAGDDEGTDRFRAICEVLQEWSQGWRIEPIIVSHREALEDVSRRLVDCQADRWTCLFCKRAMIAEAQAVARQHHAHGIVLGDSLGQVASQTLENIRVISSGAEYPIYRPLIGVDKVEVMALARKIGTYDLSAQSQPACPYLPDRPLTQASFDKFLALQEHLSGLASDET